MRLGTPGFVGARLREAREARGLTAPALAQILGLTKQIISQYELDQASPHPDILRRLSIVLNQPPDFFLKRRERQKSTIFFRSRVATTESARTRAEILLHWQGDIARELWRYVQFPTVKFSPFVPSVDPLKMDRAAIEEAATATRRYWGLMDGPISNIIWLLENNGAIVSRGEIEEPNMDSFSRFGASDQAPFIFLNADKSSAVRSRFDAAHELGHCVLHSAVSVDYWSNASKDKVREQQASQFASAFLLPAETFSRDVIIPSLETFVALKPKWRVSVQAMLMRSEDLGLVSEGHAARLWRNLSRRGWRIREPFDDEWEAEVPRLLPKAIELLRQKNPQAPLELAKTIPLSPEDTAYLTMMPLNAFDVSDSKVVQFRRHI